MRRSDPEERKSAAPAVRRSARPRRWPGHGARSRYLVGGALPVVITLLGWLIAIRGAVLLALPQDAVIKFFEALRYEERLYVYMGVTLVLGLFLTFAGFSA